MGCSIYFLSILLLLYSTVFCCLMLRGAGWNVTPHTHSDANTSSVSFHDKHMSYIGGKDYLLVINRTTKNVSRVRFESDKMPLSWCKQFSKESCYNCLKIIEQIDNNTLMICGTNAGSPSCYRFTISDQTRSPMLQSARWLSSDPTTTFASTILRHNIDVELYVGSCPKTGCSIQRLVSRNLKTISGTVEGVQFVDVHVFGSDQRKIYFFFREESDAYVLDQFTAGAGKSPFGFVGRICEGDTGGSYTYRREWMTFMKVRLLCPYPGGKKTGSQNSYFDYLRSTVKIGDTVYAIFSYPSDWNLERSAVCAYKFSDIDSHIDGTAFPSNQTVYYDSSSPPTYGKTYNVASDLLPGQCPHSGQSTKTVDITYENFVASSSLIKAMVKPIHDKAIYVQNDMFNYVAGIQMNGYDLLYLLKVVGSGTEASVFTQRSSQTLRALHDSFETSQYSALMGVAKDNGLLQKLTVPHSGGEAELLTTTQVFDTSETSSVVKSFSATDKELVIVMNDKVLSLPFASCSSYDTCAHCESDPHCSWRIGCVDSLTNEMKTSICLNQTQAPQLLPIDSKFPIQVAWKYNASYGSSASFHTTVIRKKDNFIVYEETSNGNITINNNDLEKGETYMVEVTSTHNNVRSEKSVSVFSTPLSKPLIRQVQRSMSECEVTWDAVDSAKSYNIYKTQSTQPSFVVFPHNDHDQISFKFVDLEKNEDFAATVVAISDNGIYSNLTTIDCAEEHLTTQQQTFASTTTLSTTINEQTTFPREKSTFRQETTAVTTQTSYGVSYPTLLSSAKKLGDSTPELSSGSVSGLLVMIAVFVVLFVVVLLILMQNHFALGRRTSILVAEDGNVSFVRVGGVFWKRESTEENVKYSKKTHGEATNGNSQATPHVSDVENKNDALLAEKVSC